MKNNLLFLVLILSAPVLLAQQVKFCPPGAYWNYSFVNIPEWNRIYKSSNEQIVYTGDSIAAGDTIKFLTHKKYYSTCFNSQQTLVKRTMIKQKGDTIFFRNAITYNSWQILINFACPIGGSWQTTYNNAYGAPITYVFTVDSIKQVIENSFSLKRLYTPYGMFTERFGCHNFLFPFYSYAGGCDGLYFAEFLCYTDQSFGTKQFTDKACTFSGQININAIAENAATTDWQLSPNPSSSLFTVTSNAGQQYNYQLCSIAGEILKSGEFDGSLVIDAIDFAPGLYFLNLSDGEYSKCLKLVKE